VVDYEADREHVALLGVLVGALQDVRWRVDRRADHPGIPHALLILLPKPIIPYLNRPLLINKNILRLQISVHIARPMNILQSTNHPPRHPHNLLQSQRSAARELRQLTVAAVLTHNVHFVVELELFDELHDVFVAERFHYLDFPCEERDFGEEGLFGPFQLFQGDLLAAVGCEVDLSEGSSADAFDYRIFPYHNYYYISHTPSSPSVPSPSLLPVHLPQLLQLIIKHQTQRRPQPPQYIRIRPLPKPPQTLIPVHLPDAVPSPIIHFLLLEALHHHFAFYCVAWVGDCLGEHDGELGPD
jgi:hypothetical protein